MCIRDRIESARSFQNYTYYQSDKIVDKMDIVYIAKTVENYVDFVPKEKEVTTNKHSYEKFFFYRMHWNTVLAPFFIIVFHTH